MSAFKEVVETKLDGPCGRLARLMKYTSGEAKELVRNCIHVPPEECHEETMALLQDRYGDPYQVLGAYCREIRNWPVVKQDDACALRGFSNFLMKCRSILSESSWNQLDNPDVLCLLMAILPGYLQDRWNKQVLMIRRKPLRELKLTDLIDFVNEETALVNNALFSRHAVSQYVKGQHKSERRDKKRGKSRIC